MRISTKTLFLSILGVFATHALGKDTARQDYADAKCVLKFIEDHLSDFPKENDESCTPSIEGETNGMDAVAPVNIPAQTKVKEMVQNAKKSIDFWAHWYIKHSPTGLKDAEQRKQYKRAVILGPVEELYNRFSRDLSLCKKPNSNFTDWDSALEKSGCNIQVEKNFKENLGKRIKFGPGKVPQVLDCIITDILHNKLDSYEQNISKKNSKYNRAHIIEKLMTSKKIITETNNVLKLHFFNFYFKGLLAPVIKTYKNLGATKQEMHKCLSGIFTYPTIFKKTLDWDAVKAAADAEKNIGLEETPLNNLLKLTEEGSKSNLSRTGKIANQLGMETKDLEAQIDQYKSLKKGIKTPTLAPDTSLPPSVVVTAVPPIKPTPDDKVKIDRPSLPPTVKPDVISPPPVIAVPPIKLTDGNVKIDRPSLPPIVKLDVSSPPPVVAVPPIKPTPDVKVQNYLPPMVKPDVSSPPSVVTAVPPSKDVGVQKATAVPGSVNTAK